ncbi:MAG: GGDEF domain-containing protein [Actinobacteria bacterium]|nr:GGDEF domain-containing protein [Actinomycetota bacterium]
MNGAPWRISAAVPATALYAPLRHHRLFAPLLFAALSGASLLALLFLYRLLRRKDELHRLSRIDPLTGLINRRALQDAYQQRLAYQTRYGGREGALLVIDLDNFKQVNDRHGHQAGDRVLVAVARTLQSILRESDLAVRLGGDEFAILLPRANALQASIVAEKLRVGFNNIASAPTSVSVHASIGVALETETEPSLDALLSAADEAMYRQKPADLLVNGETRQARSRHGHGLAHW